VEGFVIRCIKDNRKKCPIFFKLPEWTGNWLHVCANCPTGTGCSLEAAIQIEQSYDSVKIYSYHAFDVEELAFLAKRVLP
jgi:hypothetical protein